MLEQSPSMANPGTSTSDANTFIYEVEGLHQNDRTTNNDYSIRSSSSVFISVPRSRMNAEMQRITRLGGKIVNISPLRSQAKAAPVAQAAAAE
jgi:hypothetical protein